MEEALGRSAFILGYSGEVGKELVKEVVKSNIYQKVVLIGRRKIEYKDESLASLEQRQVDFEKLGKETLEHFDVGFCCLGTTRAQAGAEGFYKVDHDYVLQSASLAQQGGCEEFHVVSSQGANKNSFVLYNRTKGQVEKDVTDLKFKRLFIYRPAILLCDREKSRATETVAKFLLRPLFWGMPTLLSVSTATVAKCMVAMAAGSHKQPQGVILLNNTAIHQTGTS